jgi:hypothetical protein
MQNDTPAAPPGTQSTRLVALGGVGAGGTAAPFGTTHRAPTAPALHQL